MSLLDDLRNLLARHLAHVNTQTQQGTVALIEDHLNRLDAVVGSDFAAGEAKVHEVLGELYAATNAPAGAAPSAPAPVAAPVPVAEAAPETAAAAPANPTSMAPSALATPEPAPAPVAEETPAAPAVPDETTDAPAAPTAETNPAA